MSLARKALAVAKYLSGTSPTQPAPAGGVIAPLSTRPPELTPEAIAGAQALCGFNEAQQGHPPCSDKPDYMLGYERGKLLMTINLRPEGQDVLRGLCACGAQVPLVCIKPEGARLLYERMGDWYTFGQHVTPEGVHCPQSGKPAFTCSLKTQ